MNAYDFDNTIYDGESIVDFFLFCLKKDIKLLKYLPNIIFLLFKYKLNLVNIETILNFVNKFSASFFNGNKTDYNKLAEEFWLRNEKKLKPQFLKKLKRDDLIITGCPNFLLDHIKDKLKTKNIICTIFDLEKRQLEFLCFGENKVKEYKKQYENKSINKFYTDSLADIPFMKISDEVYLVKNNNIKKVDKSKYND